MDLCFEENYMKAIQVKEFGGPEVLVYTEVAKPSPQENELLVKVEAVGVNPVDTYIRAGVYPILPVLPYIPGKDVAGTIAEVGKNVTGWQIGDRVYSSGTLSGGYAEFAICAPHQVFSLPDNTSFNEGAAVGVPGATAWRGLFIRGEGQPGEKVLIHGASGSVGFAAVQLAKAAGLDVYGTASTEEGLQALKQHGVKGFYNHKDSKYIEQVKVDVPGGFNLILEMLANVNLDTDLELLAPKGRVVIIGSRGKIEIDPRATMGKETEIRGLALFNCSPDEMKKTQAALFAALGSGVFKPRISQEIDLLRAPKSHELVMNSGNCGKVLLKP